MFYPNYRKKKNNVPILSNSEINNIAEHYARDFMPQIMEQPQPFNIEGFLEAYLDLQIDYQYLSNDGRYLGMIVFNDTDKVIVFLPESNKADYIHANHGTVIIDSSLLDKKQESRYRFTLGHECGHWIFHKSYFGYNPLQMSLFDMDLSYLQCREVNKNYFCTSPKGWDDARWMEWHADKFSAGILMPETAVRLLMTNAATQYFSVYENIALMSETFNVSELAAYLRLRDLGYFQNPLEESFYKQLSLF